MKEKHLWKLASLLIAMLMGLAMVVSCSKDDGDDNGTNQNQYLSVNGTMWKFLSNWAWDSERSENYKSSLIFLSFNNDDTGEEMLFSTDDDKYDNNRHEHYYTLTARWHITFSKDDTKPITLYNIFLQGYYPTETAVEGHQMYLYHNESDNEHEICLCDNYGTPEFHGDRFTTERVYSLPTAEAIYADGTPYTGSGGSSSGGSSSGGIPSGAYKCYSCDGEGICTICNGTGRSGSYECWACEGTGRCIICDGRGYLYSNNSGGSSSGGSSSGGSSSGGSSSGGSNSSTRTCAVCGGSGKCMSTSYDSQHCYGTGTCQTCSGRGYYWFAGNEVMCPNCDIPGNSSRNTPGNGKCGFCGGSGKCKYCKGKGYK